MNEDRPCACLLKTQWYKRGWNLVFPRRKRRISWNTMFTTFHGWTHRIGFDFLQRFHWLSNQEKKFGGRWDISLWAMSRSMFFFLWRLDPSHVVIWVEHERTYIQEEIVEGPNLIPWICLLRWRRRGPVKHSKDRTYFSTTIFVDWSSWWSWCFDISGNEKDPWSGQDKKISADDTYEHQHKNNG